jgi:hypothetical protein
MYRAQALHPRLAGNLRQMGATGPYVAPPPPNARGAVVKVWMAKPGTTGGHVRYLQHGKALDGADAALFTRAGAVVDAQAFREAAQGDPHQFRFIVSLTDGDRLNLTAYTQNLMHQVERDLQRPLDWIAATHQDTAHVHTHVILRGRDRNSAPLYILKHYLSHGMRIRTRRMATLMLGPIADREERQERRREAQLDRELTVHARKAKKEDWMDDPHDSYVPNPATPDVIDAGELSDPAMDVTGGHDLLQRQDLSARLDAVLRQVLQQQRERAQEQAREEGLSL